MKQIIEPHPAFTLFFPFALVAIAGAFYAFIVIPRTMFRVDIGDELSLSQEEMNARFTDHLDIDFMAENCRP